MRMINLFAFIFLLGTTQALAYGPAKGDFTFESISVDGENFLRKNQISNINNSQDIYTISIYHVLPDGSLRLLKLERIEGAKLRASYISDLNSACTKLKGNIEQVRVPAGKFNACKKTVVVPGAEATTWYAQGIPFGIVKQITTQNGTNPHVHDLVSSGNESR